MVHRQDDEGLNKWDGYPQWIRRRGHQPRSRRTGCRVWNPGEVRPALRIFEARRRLSTENLDSGRCSSMACIRLVLSAILLLTMCSGQSINQTTEWRTLLAIQKEAGHEAPAAAIAKWKASSNSPPAKEGTALRVLVTDPTVKSLDVMFVYGVVTASGGHSYDSWATTVPVIDQVSKLSGSSVDDRKMTRGAELFTSTVPPSHIAYVTIREITGVKSRVSFPDPYFGKPISDPGVVIPIVYIQGFRNNAIDWGTQVAVETSDPAVVGVNVTVAHYAPCGAEECIETFAGTSFLGGRRSYPDGIFRVWQPPADYHGASVTVPVNWFNDLFAVTVEEVTAVRPRVYYTPENPFNWPDISFPPPNYQP